MIQWWSVNKESEDVMSDILGKVRKLLALADEAGGGTEAERELAAARAQDLMLEHNLSMLEVEAEGGEVPAFEEDTEVVSSKVDYWKGSLWHALAEEVNVRVFYTRWRGERSRTYTFAGRPDSIEYVRTLGNYLIPYLEVECEGAFLAAKADGEMVRCGKCEGTGWVGGWDLCTCDDGMRPVSRTVFRGSFYSAAVSRISERMAERRQATEDVAGERGRELIVNDKAALERYMAEHHPRMSTGYSRRSTSSAAGHASGDSAGARADLGGGRNLGVAGRRTLTA